MKHRKTYSLPASLSSFSSLQPSPTPSSDCDFVELLARSNFSFLQGGSHPDEMVLRAKQLKYKGIALCDTNGLYGIVRGFQAAEVTSAFDNAQLAQSKEPFQYICGTELTPYDSAPIVLIPTQLEGYTRLCRLITDAKRRAPKGQIVISLNHILESDQDLLAIALPPWKEADLKRLQDAFSDRLYLPVYKDFSWESVRLYHQALQLEQSMGLTLFATQRPLFHEPARKPLHDVLTCILHKSTLEEAATRLSLNRERYLKSTPEIAKLFLERPDLIARTLEIAARIRFSLKELRYKYPQGHLPEGKTAPEFLRELVEKGLHFRYMVQSRVNSRNHNRDLEKDMEKARIVADKELALIKKLEYEDYFLTLWDICNFARSENILFQGRGSAANSVVCFAIGLTSSDPIDLDLLFERFLSEKRSEPPDIDIDFEHESREKVIQYIYKKYGEKRAAMVCTVICYRSRMAVREVAKVMGVPLPKINALIKFMGREGISNLLDESVDFSRFGLTQGEFRQILDLSLALRGFPRHLGIHSGGFVISHHSIVDIVPVENATMEGRYVIQWNKDDINTLGLMKIDILSLGMLTALRKSFDMLRTHKGLDWNDFIQIPSEDEATYKMIQRADTVGVFQIESRAQMSLLPRLRPKTYYDLVIEVAIVRPGPIQGGMVHPYLRRRSGKEPVTYAHPDLKPILGKTCGIPLFQEQIMKMVVAVAGFTAEEADELRRIMSSAWKKKAIMDGVHQRVVNGILSKANSSGQSGLSREYAEQIYKTIEGFASFGFPESHAASFAILTYASCYLKWHYPDVFVCALLNSQPLGFYPPRQLISEAQRNGVPFLALDIQNSGWDYSLNKVENPVRNIHPRAGEPFHAVRVGLRSIHGLNKDQALHLIQERELNGAFDDLSDLVKRTHLPKATVIRIAAAGAFTSFGLSPREAMWIIQGLSFDESSLLFGANLEFDSGGTSLEVRSIPQESEWQSVHREFQTKGFSITDHPIAVLRPYLPHSPARQAKACELSQLKNRTNVRIYGLKSLVQTPPTAKGMCFISLEDESGLFNVVVMPDLYQKCRLTIHQTPLLEIDGQLESYEGVYNIRAKSIRAIQLSDRLSGTTSATVSVSGANHSENPEPAPGSQRPP
jgi:DNA-directed DNA polymerase III PolC